MYYFTGTVNLMAQIGFKLPCSRAAEPGRRAPCCITNSHMPRRENANTPASAQAQQDAVSEGIENFELPRALVTRIAKSAVRCRFSYRYMEQLFLTLSWQVPDNVKLQKDTVLSLVKGATVFINYLGALSTLSTSQFFFDPMFTAATYVVQHYRNPPIT